MGYSSEFGKNAAQGGPFPAGKKNSRPQSYTGKYTSDGKPNMGQQAFRKELPAPKTSDALPDGQYDGSGVTNAPTFEDVYRKWK